MINILKDIYVKHKQIILYIILGICTTLVNIVTYFVCYEFLKVPNVSSNIISWILSVSFAYITNKILVFESKSVDFKDFLKELISFFACRVVTGVIDIIIMYICVDILMLQALSIKILSNILVIVLNFVASKLIIFRNGS